MRLHIALDDERRWDDIEAALGGIADTGHDWDDDPAEWVRRQRRGDRRRSGALATANVRDYPMAAVEVREWPAG